jgi:hypothetical protein
VARFRVGVGGHDIDQLLHHGSLELEVDAPPTLEPTAERVSVLPSVVLLA